MNNKNNEKFAPTFFGDIFNDAKLLGKNWFEKEFGQTFPAVNINESNKEFNLEFASPGFKKEDFKVEISQKALSISCVRAPENEVTNEHYSRKEFSSTSFKRTFNLPETVNVDAVQANYENGVLTLSLPKREEALPKPKRLIEIK